MEQFLDFENAKVQQITLGQLERTHRENDVYGSPLKGIYHFQLISDILGMAEQLGYNVEVYDMFAAQNKDRQTPGVVLLPQIEEQFGKRAIEAHILRRVYANVRISDFDNDDNTTNMAIAFHQRGIQVGFGTMVKICHNQCMLSADRYISTYSDKGNGRSGELPTIEDIKEIVKSWLVDAKKIVVADRKTIQKMKKIEVGAQEIFTLIGLLTTIRVKCDSLHREIRENKVYPLSQGQINQFTESLLLKYHQAERISVWDIYNAATDLYKVRSMDIPNMLPQNRAMVELLKEQYNF